jgi:hypothetical protein
MHTANPLIAQISTIDHATEQITLKQAPMIPIEITFGISTLYAEILQALIEKPRTMTFDEAVKLVFVHKMIKN